MASENRSGFMSSVQKASLYLSVVATALSLWTYYLVDLKRPKLQLQMPEEVGVDLYDDSSLDLLVPTVFFNSGAQHNPVVVTDVTATLTPSAADEAMRQPLHFYWQDTNRFVSQKDYAKEYPNEGALADVHDYVLYDNRSYPFILFSESSATKVLHFLQKADGTVPKIGNLFSFGLSLEAKTTSKSATAEANYFRGVGLTKGQYAWFRRVK